MCNDSTFLEKVCVVCWRLVQLIYFARLGLIGIDSGCGSSMDVRNLEMKRPMRGFERTKGLAGLDADLSCAPCACGSCLTNTTDHRTLR